MISSLINSYWYGRPDKRDDDMRLLDLHKWENTFNPMYVEADGNPIVQKERVNAMVARLLRLRPLETLEGEIERHCVLVVETCSPEVRSYLIVALAPSAYEQPIGRIQGVICRTCSKWRP